MTATRPAQNRNYFLKINAWPLKIPFFLSHSKLVTTKIMSKRIPRSVIGCRLLTESHDFEGDSCEEERKHDFEGDSFYCQEEKKGCLHP